MHGLLDTKKQQQYILLYKLTLVYLVTTELKTYLV